MRYPASEKLEIIRTVEGSHLPTKQTLDMLGIPRSTFYRWYDLYLEDGLDGLSDKSPSPKSVWNRIPDDRREKGCPAFGSIANICVISIMSPSIDESDRWPSS